METILTFHASPWFPVPVSTSQGQQTVCRFGRTQHACTEKKSDLIIEIKLLIQNILTNPFRKSFCLPMVTDYK